MRRVPLVEPKLSVIQIGSWFPRWAVCGDLTMKGSDGCRPFSVITVEYCLPMRTDALPPAKYFGVAQSRRYLYIRGLSQSLMDF